MRNVVSASLDHLVELDSYVCTERSHFSRPTKKHPQQSTTVHMSNDRPVGDKYVTINDIGIVEASAYCNSSFSIETLIQTPPKINMSQWSSLDSTGYVSMSHPSECESVTLTETVTTHLHPQDKGICVVHEKSKQSTNTPKEGEWDNQWIQRPLATDRNIQTSLSGLKLRRNHLREVEHLYFV